MLAVIAMCGAAFVTGCSNDDDDGDAGSGGGPGGGELTRGGLIESPPAEVVSITASDLLSDDTDPLQQALLLQAGTPVCDISVHKLRYSTVGGDGESTEASAALMVPTGSDARCTGARPIVLYAHGTSTDVDYDISDLGDDENAEGLLVAAFFAAQGYVVVAPNYAGYDTSTLGYHPYLVADQQSKDMIDALVAARSALPVASAANTTDGGELYLTGYSQGGHVALATEREMEAMGMNVTAAVPMSGPYAMNAFVDAIFAGRVNGGSTVQGAFLFTTYDRLYGDVYADPGELFADPYAEGIESLFPSTVPRSQLYDEGQLPPDALFSSTPPDPEFADVTPATTPADLAPLFERGFAATDFLIGNDFRLAYLRDAAAHPDGFWPETTTSTPATGAELGLRQALVRNDLRNFTPSAPTLLCGGNDDPVVFWLNTQAMQAYWATEAPDAEVTVLDVDAAPAGDDDPYENLKQEFGLAKDLVATLAVAQGATDGGREAVLEVYHAGLVAPFCLEAARDFFEQH